MTFSKELISAIHNTWSAIGSDVLDIDPVINNYGALEMVLEADRLDIYGNSTQASSEYRNLIGEYGWVPLLETLCKEVRLV